MSIQRLAFLSPKVQILNAGRILAYSLIAVTLIFPIGISRAQETTEHTNGIIVKHAVVDSAKTGNRSYLHFSIVNFSADNISLNGVRTNAATAVELEMNMPGRGYRLVSNVPILRDETLNLLTSHIRVGLTELTRDIEPGSEVEFEIVFQDFVMTAVATAN